MVTEWHWVLETPTSNTSAVVPVLSPSFLPSREPGNEDRLDVPHRHRSYHGFHLPLHFPPTKRHRHRDLTVAKALLFLSNFRKKTKPGKRQKRGFLSYFPLGLKWQHSTTQQVRGTVGSHLPSHISAPTVAAGEQDRGRTNISPLFPQTEGGQASLITTLIIKNPIPFPE